jgi:hypothetical protein
MQTLNVIGPPHAQARYARIRTQARDLFIQRHQADEIIDSILDRQIGILKWILIRHSRGSRRDQPQPNPSRGDAAR